MTTEEQAAFREYLQRIPDDLLESVAEDYVWLANQFEDDSPAPRYVWRRDACREECARRGRPRLFKKAERLVASPMREVA